MGGAMLDNEMMIVIGWTYVELKHMLSDGDIEPRVRNRLDELVEDIEREVPGIREMEMELIEMRDVAKLGVRVKLLTDARNKKGR